MIKVSLPVVVRRRLFHALTQNDQSFDRWVDNFNYTSSVLRELPENILSELGCKELVSFPEDGGSVPVKSDLEGFVLRGPTPAQIFDVMELFYEASNQERKVAFQSAFNQIMAEQLLGWRMAEGKVFPVDSAYIEEEILRATTELLHSNKFHGALDEFQKARTDLINGDNAGAIQNANLCVESVIKGILKIEQEKPGKLFKKVMDAGYIPEYMTGFLNAFEEHILRGVATIRNSEKGAGHGQGASINKIHPELAELAVNLAGVLTNFLIKRYLAKMNIHSEISSSNGEESSDVPF